MAWSQTFADPIILPDGRELVTLRDAGAFITGLPPADQQAPEWQTAARVLLMIGERGGDPMMAHIAMLRALHRDRPTPKTPRRKAPKAFRIVR